MDPQLSFNAGIAATQSARLAVLARKALPDIGPRKDWGVRLEGPVVREVEIAALQKIQPAFLRTDFLQPTLQGAGVEGRVADRLQRAGDARFGRQADGQVQVRATLLEHRAQELVYRGHGVSRSPSSVRGRGGNA